MSSYSWLSAPSTTFYVRHSLLLSIGITRCSFVIYFEFLLHSGLNICENLFWHYLPKYDVNIPSLTVTTRSVTSWTWRWIPSLRQMSHAPGVLRLNLLSPLSECHFVLFVLQRWSEKSIQPQFSCQMLLYKLIRSILFCVEHLVKKKL